MAAEITRHGGKIEKYIGDAIMAVFGLPRPHEDDALRAVRAAHGHAGGAARAQRRTCQRRYGVGLANRTGVNTGEVVANDDPSADQQLATGDAVNVAARLEQAAPENEILIGETHVRARARRGRGRGGRAARAQGQDRARAAYRLVGVARRARRPAPRRHADRRPRRASWRRSTRRFATPTAARGVRAGDGRRRRRRRQVAAGPGVHRRGPTPRPTCVRGRCLPYGEGITFWPLVEIVARGGRASATRTTPRDGRARSCSTLVGDARRRRPRRVPRSASRPRAVPAAGAVLGGAPVPRGAGRDRPAGRAGRRHPLGRADVPRPARARASSRATARRSCWSAPRATSCSSSIPNGASAPATAPIVLRAARRRATRTSIIEQPARRHAGLPDEVRRGSSTAAEGNPLFVEQMLSMLVDSGALRRGRALGPTGRSARSPSRRRSRRCSTRASTSSAARSAPSIEPASVIGLQFPEPAVDDAGARSRCAPTVERAPAHR